MTLDHLQRRIARAEAVLEHREARVSSEWRAVRTTWRTAWTPTRVILLGLGLGFLAGRSRPLATASLLAGRLGDAPKLIQAISAFSALATAFMSGDSGKPAKPAAATPDADPAPDPTPPAAPPDDAPAAASPHTAPAAAADLDTTQTPPASAHAAEPTPPYEIPDTFREEGRL